MSSYFKDEHEHQSIPPNRRRERADGYFPASQPPTTAASRAPVHAAPYAAPFSQQHKTTRELLNLIGMADTLSEDLQKINDEGDLEVDEFELGRLVHLVDEEPKLEKWLGTTGSPRLLIEGDCRVPADISSLSILCQCLLDATSQSPVTYLPLVFFCGLHTSLATDDHAGGRGIIRSFICQLLLRYPFYAEDAATPVFLDELNALDDVRNGNLRHLFAVFERLVCMLPWSVTVVCMVDGVGHYEYGQLERDFQLVLGAILRLSTQLPAPGRSHAALRVLLTSPQGTATGVDWVPQDSIVWMSNVRPGPDIAHSEDIVRELTSVMRCDPEVKEEEKPDAE